MKRPPSELRERWSEAQVHITERFNELANSEIWNERRRLNPQRAVSIVETAVEYERDVTPEDIRAALCLIPVARGLMDAEELGLIRAARAASMTWDEIGDLLGLGDRRQGQQRFKRLSERLGLTENE
jgi:hypothetical protein